MTTTAPAPARRAVLAVLDDPGLGVLTTDRQRFTDVHAASLVIQDGQVHVVALQFTAGRLLTTSGVPVIAPASVLAELGWTPPESRSYAEALREAMLALADELQNGGGDLPRGIAERIRTTVEEVPPW